MEEGGCSVRMEIQNKVSLESVAPLLQGMQKPHKELVVQKILDGISFHRVKGCDPCLLIEPDGVVSLFHRRSPLLKHSQRHGFCGDVHLVVVGPLQMDQCAALIGNL